MSDHDPDLQFLKPFAELVKPSPMFPENGIQALQFIEYCARISHRSEDKITADSWEPFIRAVVLQHGDWSVVEHSSASVLAYVDRGVTHEWVRHRLMSYTQESTRFVNYEKKMPPSFVPPPFEAILNEPALSASQRLWEAHMVLCSAAYRKLLEHGCPPQIARSVFPTGLASKMVITANLRSWRHFFIMRTTKESHPQMRQVTVPLLSQFRAMFPLIFDDIVAGARQADNMKLPK